MKRFIPILFLASFSSPAMADIIHQISASTQLQVQAASTHATRIGSTYAVSGNNIQLGTTTTTDSSNNTSTVTSNMGGLTAGTSATSLDAATMVNGTYEIKLIGDRSLSKRDFLRITTPLEKFGVNFKKINYNGLPLKITGSKYLKPIHYEEEKGSAQCKSSVMLAALNAPGRTIIKAKKSRDHTELFFKYLKLPIKVLKKKKYDIIEISGEKQFKSFNYIVPGDISSSAFFIVLTLLSKNSKLKIKNVNINPSRTGFITILNRMGGKIKFLNKRNVYGENVADIFVESQDKFKPINCPVKLNSNAIDEFLIIFLLASKASGISSFRGLEELDKKESPRLQLASKILKKMGIKIILGKGSIKIFGDPNTNIMKKKILINKYRKDHRIFMTSVIASLSLGGEWVIEDAESHKSSFPSFLRILRKLGYKF